MKTQKGKTQLRMCLAAGSLALVLGLPSQAMAREGVFFGAAAGWSNNDVELAGGDVSVDGAGGSMFAGYGWQSIHGFFAVEGNIGIRNAEGDLIAFSDSSIESDMSYGLGVLLGGRLEGATPYLRLGWQTSNYELKGGADSDDQDHDGIRYGIGALLPLQRNLDMRLEWSQTRYSEESYFDGALELEPTESLFTVGLSLHY